MEKSVRASQHRHERRGGLVVPYKAAVAVGILVLAAAIGVPLWQFVFTSSSKPNAPAIHFRYPKNWAQVAPSKIGGAPKNTAAALARNGGGAVLIVLRNGPTTITSHSAARINSQLKAKYPDFKPLRSQPLALPAGPALLVAYERTKQGKHGELHTITIIPAGPISYVLESASPPGNSRIDRELERIIASAQLTRKK